MFVCFVSLCWCAGHRTDRTRQKLERHRNLPVGYSGGAVTHWDVHRPAVKRSLAVNILPSWWISAAQWRSIMAPPIVRCDWLLWYCASSSQMAVTDTQVQSWRWMTSSTGTSRFTILMQSGSVVSTRQMHRRHIFPTSAAPTSPRLDHLCVCFVRELSIN